MLDHDRVSMGWSVFLTPRETYYLLKLMKKRRGRPKKKDRISHDKLVEWFGKEVETHTRVRGKLTDEQE